MVTASGIGGATVELRQGQNTTTGAVVRTAVSAGDGTYSIASVAAGTYTVTARATGFVTGSSTGVIVGAQCTGGQDVVLSPVDGGSSNLRVVLTWGATPSDLDSHLWGRSSPARTRAPRTRPRARREPASRRSRQPRANGGSSDRLTTAP